MRSSGQTNINVLNFGAVGDAECFSVDTVSNSTVVSVAGTNTFTSGDVGKVIEVFRAGPWVYYNSAAVVTQQDIICLITNVSQGTNLSLSIPCGWTTNAYCVVGTNNAPAFQAAINRASSLVASGQYTNVTIQIPAGRYLMVSSNVLNPNYVMNSISDTHPAVTISSGGITLLGDSATNTILMSCGAGMEHQVAGGLAWIGAGYAPYVPMRDTLVECRGPVANSQDPLVFENLTLDGGLTNGQQSYNYWIPIQGNGAGWDTTHHAIADSGGVNNVNGQLVQWQMNQMKLFTNCVFQHWRGEMCICWTADITNAFNDWENCQFLDGNATADNMYYGQKINHCVFNGVGKVMEYYQDNASSDSIMENCLVTNISAMAGPGNVHVDCALTGAVTNRTMPSFTFFNNQFYDNVGMEFFSLNAAENVSFVSNNFVGTGPGINLTGIGQQPSDGTQVWYMTNILVMGNTFSCPAPLSIGFAEIEDLMCSNNTHFSISASIGYATNIILSGNSGSGISGGPWYPGDTGNHQIISGQYAADLTNNNWTIPWPYSMDGGARRSTNLLSYGNGRVHMLQASGAIFYLDDTHPGMIPVGAIMEVFKTNNVDSRNATNFYTSAVLPVPPMTITNGAAPVTFYWTGTSWVNGAVVPFSASPSAGASGLGVQFQGPGTNTIGNAIVSWSWSFGDGTFSTAQNPSHVYTIPGTYSPTLTVIDSAGMSSAGLGLNILVTNPVVSFNAGASLIVAGTSVQFTAPRADSGGNGIVNWTWNFGDGTMGAGQNPVHTYTSLGTFYPVLTATNVYGVSALGSGPGITVTNPSVQFTVNLTNTCPKFTIQFTSPNVDSGGNPITSWQWDFGDGTGSTAQNPTHSYASAGTYHPVLSVRNAYGLAPAGSGPSSVNVINPGVTFSDSPSNGVSRLNVQFQSPAADSLGVAIAGWHWNFGDGTMGVGQNPVHAYSSVGTFYPVLIATNSVGDLATNNGADITVTNPVIQFTVSRTNLCPNLAVQFSAPATDSGGNPVASWTWDFGDGTQGAGQNPTHSYATNGTYHPMLSARNAYGITATGTGVVIAVVSPGIAFTVNPTNGMSRLAVQFQSPAADSLGVTVTGWHWDFGDGSTGVGENPAHTYTNLGTFYPVLTATNSVGVLSTNMGEGITVTNPMIAFTVTPGSGNASLAVQFQSPATDTGGNAIRSWTWNFGDGTTGTGENPTHMYTKAGNYYPVLLATNIYGVPPLCSGSAVSVMPNGTASANIVASPPPPPLTVAVSGANAVLSWPATADNCTLQWTTNMGPAAVWFTANSPAVEVNGRYVVTNFAASSNMYFRLKQTTASSSQTSPPSGSISDLLTWLLQHGGQ